MSFLVKSIVLCQVSTYSSYPYTKLTFNYCAGSRPSGGARPLRRRRREAGRGRRRVRPTGLHAVRDLGH